jgi:hypothetical protein
MAAGWRRSGQGNGVPFLKATAGKIRGYFAKVFRLAMLAGGLVVLVVVLDALLSPEGPSQDRS